MTGADAPRCGVTVALDPVPLDVLGELRAVMDGLATFDLSFTGGRYEIDRRDQWRIEGNPPCSGNFDVLAEHRCQRYNIAGTSTQFVGADNPANPDGPPPF